VTSAYIHTDRYKKKDVAGSDYRKVEILTMRSTRRFRPQDDAMASSAVGKAVFARVGVERNKKQCGYGLVSLRTQFSRWASSGVGLQSVYI
jgi:transketolase